MKKQQPGFPFLFTLLICMIMISVFLLNSMQVPGVRIEKPFHESIPAPSGSSDEPVYPININTADASVLDHLPGIGPAIAGRIVQYRQEHGSFSCAEDLLLVSGIGPELLSQLIPYLTTGG